MRRRFFVVVLVGLVLAPAATGAEKPRLTEARATAIFLAHPKVADWLERYPAKGRTTEATYDSSSGAWEAGVWWDEAGQIAKGLVDDASGRVTEAWTGPQVAWTMARGYEGAFGGDELERLPVWLGFCALFLLGLADLRRPLSLRNLDLLVLLSFSVSLWYFNRGDIFTSVPLVYPPLVYLLARMLWVGFRGRTASGSRPSTIPFPPTPPSPPRASSSSTTTCRTPRDAASAGRIGFHDCQCPPRPWIMSRGLPAPRRIRSTKQISFKGQHRANARLSREVA